MWYMRCVKKKWCNESSILGYSTQWSYFLVDVSASWPKMGGSKWGVSPERDQMLTAMFNLKSNIRIHNWAQITPASFAGNLTVYQCWIS